MTPKEDTMTDTDIMAAGIERIGTRPLRSFQPLADFLEDTMTDALTPALTFKPYNDALPVDAATWVKVADDYWCPECRDRGGWMPRVWESDCPVCYGEDPYGGSYCGACEYCCGC